MLSSYTVKKMLPRLIAAVILIQFSYYLVAILVDIFNILGRGIDGILLAAVRNVGFFANVSEGTEAGAATTLVGLGLGGFAAVTGLSGVAAAGVGALFLLLLPALIAVMGVFFTIVFRQVLVIMLAILSPVAFAAMVLPGTEKLFKLWWSSLLRALAMYPLIILLMAGGTIVALIASNLGGNANSFLGVFLALAAIIVPLALIPFTFKMAGATIAGFANGFSAINNRLAYGKDGKGGYTANMRQDAERRKRQVAAGLMPETRFGRAVQRMGLRRASIVGTRSGLGVGPKAASKATIAMREATMAAEEDLKKKGFNNGTVLSHFAEVGDNQHRFDDRVAALRAGSPSDQVLAEELEGMRDYVGRRDYQGAALKSAAAMGNAGDAAFVGTHAAMVGNAAIRSSTIKDAASASKEKNLAESGWAESAPGVLRAQPRQDEAVRDSIVTMKAEDIASHPNLFEILPRIKEIISGDPKMATPGERAYMLDQLENALGPAYNASPANKALIDSIPEVREHMLSRRGPLPANQTPGGTGWPAPKAGPPAPEAATEVQYPPEPGEDPGAPPIPGPPMPPAT